MYLLIQKFYPIFLDNSRTVESFESDIFNQLDQKQYLCCRFDELFKIILDDKDVGSKTLLLLEIPKLIVDRRILITCLVHDSIRFISSIVSDLSVYCE